MDSQIKQTKGHPAMLKNKRQNYHHTPHMPALGAIVELTGLLRNSDPAEVGGKWIVESFPLTDSPDYRHSIGIHTVNLRRLSDGTQKKVSAFWCDVLHWM